MTEHLFVPAFFRPFIPRPSHLNKVLWGHEANQWRNLPISKRTSQTSNNAQQSKASRYALQTDLGCLRMLLSYRGWVIQDHDDRVQMISCLLFVLSFLMRWRGLVPSIRSPLLPPWGYSVCRNSLHRDDLFKRLFPVDIFPSFLFMAHGSRYQRDSCQHEYKTQPQTSSLVASEWVAPDY